VPFPESIRKLQFLHDIVIALKPSIDPTGLVPSLALTTRINANATKLMCFTIGNNLDDFTFTGLILSNTIDDDRLVDERGKIG
jgi:hypothetical protein